MSHPSTLDLDRYSSLDKSRRSNSRSQPRVQARNGDPLCDFCTTRKQKAEKSCLVCLASYCETHLQSHYEYPALMKHKLVKATGQMREKMCAQHDKLLEAFCRTDETSVCVLCMMDEHKHHDIVPAGTERTEKQKQLGVTLHKSQYRIDQRIKKWQDLRQSVDAVKHSAQMVLDENERIFTELLLSIERKYNEVKEMIRSHEKSTVTRGEILLDRLEEEITLLKKRHNDLEKLSHTDDHIHFLQSWQSLSGPSGYEDLNNISVVPNYNFDSTKRAISAMRLQIEEVSKTEMSKISGAVKEVYITQEAETKTRRESSLMEEPRPEKPVKLLALALHGYMAPNHPPIRASKSTSHGLMYERHLSG
uniref:B box-type domain-containing protein n=1 Tax=Amphiprion ocellaris TaxID=80972 RepID=A0AAQ5Z2A6_AMPOC